MSNSLWAHGLQDARPPCLPLSPGICWSSWPESQWFCLTISSSAAHFSFAASGSFPLSQLFASDGQRIGISASASVLPMNFQGWLPLGLTGLISLLSKELSRVFSSTTIQKHQFFSAQSFLWSSSHIHTWLLETQLWLTAKAVEIKSNMGWYIFP